MTAGDVDHAVALPEGVTARATVAVAARIHPPSGRRFVVSWDRVSTSLSNLDGELLWEEALTGGPVRVVPRDLRLDALAICNPAHLLEWADAADLEPLAPGLFTCCSPGLGRLVLTVDPTHGFFTRIVDQAGDALIRVVGFHLTESAESRA